MKIALAQLNYHIGNIKSNTDKIISHIDEAKKAGADIVAFAELSICGYSPLDLLEFYSFINDCSTAVNTIASKCKGIAAIVGAPGLNTSGKGKKLFNSAYFLADGKVQHIAHKGLLPTYDVFDEYRYFEPSRSFNTIDYKGKRIALTICEDLWGLSTHPMYLESPMDELYKQKPDVMINIAASPFSYNHAAERKDVLGKNATKYKLPLLYVNHVGAHTDLIFDGGSMGINKKGETINELPYFTESLTLFELNNNNDLSTKAEATKTSNKIALIHDALVLGIKDYFAKSGFTKAILGLSGGIDSAIVAVLAQRALGKDNVRGILMPSQYSSNHSIKDAQDLAHNLGIQHDIIEIKDIFKSFENGLSDLFKDTTFNIAEENIQARSRGTLLMAISNKFGNILLNTTNKSEMAVGYGTLYGDMCGGLSVLGDVYKTEIYQLANYINEEGIVIPTNTITKAPSAELHPDQKDSDSLPEYDILDDILYKYIELRMDAKSIISSGHEEVWVVRVLRMVNNNEYKRFQAAPVLRVSPKAFGFGRKMPIVAKYN
jgi:NAD+ synthase (glutamine-hydrolysing)